MQNSKNRQIIPIVATALVTFVASAFLFSVTDINLFGTSGNISETTGTVSLADGSPVNRALLEIHGADGSAILGVSNREGNFSIDSLKAGSYVAIISTPREEYGYVGSISVKGGTDILKFDLAETGALSGIVTGCDASCVVNITFNDVTVNAENTEADGSPNNYLGLTHHPEVLAAARA